jgi:hypothetical protein
MTRPGSLAILLAVLPWGASAQDLLPPGVLLLSRIKRHVREELTHLPDYTCLETIERYRSGPSGKGGLKPMDTVRVEVLYTGKEEYFAAPGERNFRDANPAAYAAGGLNGTGIFALHLRTLFVNDNGMSSYRGEEEIEGHRTVRYEYHIPVNLSGYTIQLPEGSGNVAIRGSFWADPESLDVVRLDVEAYDIPPSLPLAEAVSIMHYGRMKIGDRSVMLPQIAEVALKRTNGEASRNVMEFTHCRSFHAESSVSFEATGLPGGSVATGLPQAQETDTPAPPGLTITLGLTGSLNQDDLVGEQIEARVLGNVMVKGKLAISEGTVVRGRIRTLQKSADAPGYTVVALEFMELEADGHVRRFFADLQDVDSAAGATRSVGGLTGTPLVTMMALPGVGSFFVHGDKFELPKGFRTVWKTK